MKNLYIIVLSFLLFSCKKEVEKTESSGQEIASIERGEQLFQENNCTACHQLNQKVVGPSLQDMAQIYSQKKGNLILFLKGEAKPIVKPEQYETMKINLEITKVMSDAELQSLEKYILSTFK
ncbi:MAG: c-type cytochrome [Flavobacterium sp.]|nr:c-type cytochrome [Flavobacterium sp.]